MNRTPRQTARGRKKVEEMLTITCIADCVHQVEGVCWLDEIYSCLSAQGQDEECVYFKPAGDTPGRPEV